MSETQKRPLIKIFTVGELATNCYVITCPTTRETVIIDPGDGAEMISEYCLTEQLQVTGILLTHGHFDHCLGLLELSLNFNCPSYLHKADLFLIGEAQKSAEFWLKHPVDPVPLPTTLFEAPEEIPIGLFSASVIRTSGHTPGSVCYLISETATRNPVALCSGDTLFADSIGRTDLSYSSKKDLFSSLETLKKLPAFLLLYPGHGQPTFLSQTPLY